MKTFDIEGQTVELHEDGGSRLWYCPCADFKRRQIRFGEGFCAHTAVAIMTSINDGTLSAESILSLPRTERKRFN